LNFFEKFEGFCEAVALDFAYSFDGEKATIGNFTLRVNEDSLALIIGLPQTGETYFKTKHFKDKSWVPFISRSRVSSVNWKKGIPRIWLVHPWDELAYLIQKFITCEGRFSIIYLYQEGEEHILVETDDEEEVQHPKATSPKLLMGGRKTRSMVLKEKELAKKDKIFTTYERRTRKRPQVQKGQIQEEDDRAQQAQYEHIQTLEAQ
jgi:hypothetical protein